MSHQSNLVAFLTGLGVGAAAVLYLESRYPRRLPFPILLTLLSEEDLVVPTPSRPNPYLHPLNLKGAPTVNLTMKVGKRRTYSIVAGKDRYGNPALFEELAITSNNPASFNVGILGDNELFIETPGLVGTAQISITADGSIGDQVVPITLLLEAEAVPGDAVTFGDLTLVDETDLPVTP